MPDITNDFDNNPNTDKRKQRDEEVNNDNLQPEQTKSEPELLEQTKSKEFSIPILPIKSVKDLLSKASFFQAEFTEKQQLLLLTSNMLIP